MSRRLMVAVATFGLSLSSSDVFAQGRRVDFNGDGLSDLAIAAGFESVLPNDADPDPSNPILGRIGAGGVHILYGSGRGLSADGSQFWTQDSPGIADQAEREDHFGEGLAAGDFNGDGFSDLAVGARWEDVVFKKAGSVNVFYGSALGISADGNQFWTQDDLEILGNVAKKDEMGAQLVAADFDGDGCDDLAVGVRREREGRPKHKSGGVNVLYGSATGLSSARNQLWTQDSPGVKDEAEGGELFGASLAGDDFNGDGFVDLAIGAPNEGLTGGFGAGSVTILYGGLSGLAADRQQVWHQDREDILDQAEFGDFFGNALAAGDLNGDGFADLAIAIPGEDFSDISNAGAIAVIYGSSSGLTSRGDQLWTQDSPGVLDEAETDDRFGAGVLEVASLWSPALTIADLNGDSFGDLIIGVASEDLNGVIDAGAVNVLYGSAAGLAATNNQFLTEDNTGTRETAESADQFGSSVVGLDFDGDGFDDLAAGAPWESIGDIIRAGEVIVVYGSATGLNAVRSQLWNQDRNGIAEEAEGGELFGGRLSGGPSK